MLLKFRAAMVRPSTTHFATGPVTLHDTMLYAADMREKVPNYPATDKKIAKDTCQSLFDTPFKFPVLKY